jgi:hypothetical protein
MYKLIDTEKVGDKLKEKLHITDCMIVVDILNEK